MSAAPHPGGERPGQSEHDSPSSGGRNVDQKGSLHVRSGATETPATVHTHTHKLTRYTPVELVSRIFSTRTCVFHIRAATHLSSFLCLACYANHHAATVKYVRCEVTRLIMKKRFYNYKGKEYLPFLLCLFVT